MKKIKAYWWFNRIKYLSYVFVSLAQLIESEVLKVSTRFLQASSHFVPENFQEHDCENITFYPKFITCNCCAILTE